MSEAGWGFMRSPTHQLKSGDWWVSKTGEIQSDEFVQKVRAVSKHSFTPAETGLEADPFKRTETGELTGEVVWVEFKEGGGHYLKVHYPNEWIPTYAPHIELDWCDAHLFVGKHMRLNGELHHNDTSGIPVRITVKGFIQCDDVPCGKGEK